MDQYERVHQSLVTLGLDTIEQTIDSYHENSGDSGVIEVLDHLLPEEVKSKRSKRYETKLKYAGFPFRKTMEEFDSSFQPSIGRSVIDDLMTLRFIHNRENLVYLGPLGVGKTPLSVAIGVHAPKSNISIYYVPAVKPFLALRKAFMRGRPKYTGYLLKIINEIGYLPLNREESNLLFQLVS